MEPNVSLLHASFEALHLSLPGLPRNTSSTHPPLHCYHRVPGSAAQSSSAKPGYWKSETREHRKVPEHLRRKIYSTTGDDQRLEKCVRCVLFLTDPFITGICVFLIKNFVLSNTFPASRGCTAPQMIPDRKLHDPQTGNDPQIGPQMIPNRK